MKRADPVKHNEGGLVRQASAAPALSRRGLRTPRDRPARCQRDSARAESVAPAGSTGVCGDGARATRGEESRCHSVSRLFALCVRRLVAAALADAHAMGPGGTVASTEFDPSARRCLGLVCSAR
ncbi:MAG: hypothetical protein M0C28_07825 [Candidatus Moduliflexus flocculans]|nr:hypothetical protein [Candidatus Moduliflexus flocculans]